jgi:hypothetical protein
MNERPGDQLRRLIRYYHRCIADGVDAGLKRFYEEEIRRIEAELATMGLEGCPTSDATADLKASRNRRDDA